MCKDLNKNQFDISSVQSSLQIERAENRFK